MGFRKIFLSAPPTNQLGNFLRFWQSNMKKFHQFFKRTLLLTLNKGCRLWGCFREQFEILSKKGFSAQISKLSGETFHF